MATDTVDFENTLQEIGFGDGWKWDKGSWWLVSPEPYDVRETTRKMRQLEARFVAITAIERPDKEIRLDYQWDLQGKLLSFICATSAGQMPTIADLSPAADWVEREIHEYFAVDFTGRTITDPLMTRPGDPLGINLHTEAAK